MTPTNPFPVLHDRPFNTSTISSSVESHIFELFQKEPVSDLIPPKGLCAVLPAYNEELVIGSIVLRTKNYVNHVIVIDDGSSDSTAEVAKLAGAEVIRLQHNTGKAYAILLGLRHVREKGFCVAVMLDSDGQHDPREIPRVVGLVAAGKADLVIGSRFIEKNKIPRYRQLGQKILDFFTNMGAGTRVTDSQSGFRAFSSQALENLDFRSDGFNVESDMIAHFSKRGLRILEAPISVNYNVPHKHKKHPITHGFGVFSRVINLIGYKRPLLLFGFPGASFVIVGVVTAFSSFNEYYTASKFPFATSMVSMLFLIMGMLLVIAGLILNSLLMIIKE
jgi:glycosyltransferase involved in cell wall biosynthesis